MSDEDDSKPATAPVPVSWHQGARDGGGQKLPGKGLVVLADEGQTATFASQIVKTCGSCKFYRLSVTQREFEKTNGSWFKQVVHEFGWKLRHLGSHPRELARCGQKDDLLVGPHSRACEYHKPG